MSEARRVAVTEDGRGLGSHHYASAFEATIPDRVSLSAEQWARATFEQAPAATRWFVVFGWKYVLRFRLGPGSSPAHVSGWTIATRTADAVVLEVHSPLLTAHKVVRTQSSRVTMTTFVRYERRMGRILWSAVAPVHHRTEPYLLGRSAGHLH